MIRRIPNKLPETSAIPQVRDHARIINILIDVLKSSQLKESSTTRIEVTPNATIVHAKSSTSSGSDSGSARWL